MFESGSCGSHRGPGMTLAGKTDVKTLNFILYFETRRKVYTGRCLFCCCKFHRRWACVVYCLRWSKGSNWILSSDEVENIFTGTFVHLH